MIIRILQLNFYPESIAVFEVIIIYFKFFIKELKNDGISELRLNTSCFRGFKSSHANKDTMSQSALHSYIFLRSCYLLVSLVSLQGETFSGDSVIFPSVQTAFTFPSNISLFCGQLYVTSVPC